VHGLPRRAITRGKLVLIEGRIFRAGDIGKLRSLSGAEAAKNGIAKMSYLHVHCYTTELEYRFVDFFILLKTVFASIYFHGSYESPPINELPSF
jgi:hypothetical protein